MHTKIITLPEEAITRIIDADGRADAIEIARFSLRTESGDIVGANLYAVWHGPTDGAAYSLGIESDCSEDEFEVAERDIRAEAMDLVGATEWYDEVYATCYKRSSAYLLI